MAANVAANTTLSFVLRAAQLALALIVMGTDGYAIHSFHGYTQHVDTDYDNFYDTVGVPSSWGFLMFCAAWTFLVAIFHLITGPRSLDRRLIGYIQLAVEAVALISWFAGFIAVSADIGAGTCHVGKASCTSLKAATVFGALEWLLFMITTVMTAMLVLNSARRLGTSAASPAIAMKSGV